MGVRFWTQPVIGVSVLIHAAALVWVFWVPSDGLKALGLILTNHLVITGLTLIPKSRLLGPNLSCLPLAAGRVVLTFDDGPDPMVTPQVLDILEAHGARGTFFVIGSNVDRFPDVCAEIVARGHQVENHSYGHALLFALSSARGYWEDIDKAQATILRVTGRRPRYFRAPFGFRSPLLAPVLHALGLELVSWTRRGFDTREKNPTRILKRLTRGLSSGDILLLHDRGSSLTPEGVPVCLKVLPPLLEMLRARGLQAVRLSDAVPPSAPFPSS